MSRLLSKIANLNGEKIAKKRKMKKRAMSFYDVVVDGYRLENEEGFIVYLKDTDPELTKKIVNDDLTAQERNMLLSTVCDWFCDRIEIDDYLNEFAIRRPIADFFLNGDDSIIEEDNLNMDLVKEKCFAKKKNKETGERELVFNNTKLGKLSSSERVALIKDPALVYEHWVEPAFTGANINEYITVEGADNDQNVIDHWKSDNEEDHGFGSMSWTSDIDRQKKDMHPGANKDASLDEDEKKTCGSCSYTKCGEDSKKRRMYIFNNLEK